MLANAPRHSRRLLGLEASRDSPDAGLRGSAGVAGGDSVLVAPAPMPDAIRCRGDLVESENRTEKLMGEITA